MTAKTTGKQPNNPAPLGAFLSTLWVLVMVVACMQPFSLPAQESQGSHEPGMIKILILSTEGGPAEQLKENLLERFTGAGLVESVTVELLPAEPGSGFPAAKTKGVECAASVVLFQTNPEYWNAAIVNTHSQAPFNYPFPSGLALSVTHELVGRFLVPYIYYSRGEYPQALEGFTALARRERQYPSGGDLHFWIALVQAESGDYRAAQTHLQQAKNMEFSAGRGVRAEMTLAQCIFAFHRALYDHERLTAMVEQLKGAVPQLEPWDSRSWAHARIASAAAIMMEPGFDAEESAERIDSSLGEAQDRLVLPRDDLLRAKLLQIRVDLLLKLGNREEGPNLYLQPVLGLLNDLKTIWQKHKKWGNLENISRLKKVLTSQ
ncbi:MAG: hypothetical protein GY757_10460 [bacterium]|nr:hypothetical protein [bacterium]